MANSIALSQKDIAALDHVFKLGSLTSVLDNDAMTEEGKDAKTIRIGKRTMQGLGDYDRTTGYATGDVSLTWETMTFTQDRGRKLGVDVMDNQESLMLAFGNIAGHYLTDYVTPEVDAYRIQNLFANAGTDVEANLADSAAVLAAIDAATEVLDEAEVPYEGRKLFISTKNYNLLKNAGSLTRNLGQGNDGKISRTFMELDDMQVIKMPKSRFYTAITQYDGVTAGQEAGGYIKNAATGKDINFMIVHPSVIAWQGSKHIVQKFIAAKDNQTSDQNLFFYRNYHDQFLYDNKLTGIYAHNRTT